MSRSKSLVQISLSGLIFCMTGCGAATGTGTTFGAPKLATIVDAATPANLKTNTAFILRNQIAETRSLSTQDLTASNFNALATTCSSSGTSSTCSTKADFLEFLRTEVFQKSTGNVAATQYYRYWVDVLDTAIAQTDTRLATASPTPPCLSQTPISVNFSFNINATAVTVTSKLQCWETQSAPGAATQNMAFGKDATHYHLVYRTNDNAETSGSGVRILIAKAALDGSSVDIWFVGSSYQTVSGSVTRVINAQRVMANKITGAFTFNTVEDSDIAKNMLFGNFYGNTDGTKIYMEGAYGSAGTLTDITTMTRAAPHCATLSAITTGLSASECTSISATSMPTGFGLTSPMTNATTGSATVWQADTTAKTAFKTAIDAVLAIDYTAAGVTKFGS